MLNTATCDHQESVTTGQTDRHTDVQRQTDTRQSYPYVLLCFAKKQNGSIPSKDARSEELICLKPSLTHFCPALDSSLPSLINIHQAVL